MKRTNVLPSPIRVTRSRRAQLALWLALLLIVGHRSARADDTGTAGEHYHRALHMYDLGRWVDAASEYEKVFQLDPSPPLLFKIGQAYRLGGRVSDALRAYRSYLQGSPDVENRNEVEGYINELQAEPSPSAPTPPTVSASTPTTTRVLVAPSPPMKTIAREHRPLYEKWWLWTLVGVVAAGAATGLAVGLTSRSSSFSPALGTFGPASLTVGAK